MSYRTECLMRSYAELLGGSHLVLYFKLVLDQDITDECPGHPEGVECKCRTWEDYIEEIVGHLQSVKEEDLSIELVRILNIHKLKSHEVRTQLDTLYNPRR